MSHFLSVMLLTGMSAVSSISWADVKGGPELDRSLVSMYSEGQGEVWLQGSYVDQSFAEQFGYGTTSSGLNYSRVFSVGGKYAISNTLNLRGEYSDFEDEAWRSREPKLLKSDYYGIETQLQHVFYVGQNIDLGWQLSYRSHSASNGDIGAFQFDDYLVEANGTQILVSESNSLMSEITNRSISMTLGSSTVSYHRDTPDQFFIGENVFPIDNLPEPYASTVDFDQLNQTLASIDAAHIVNAEPSDSSWGASLIGGWYPSSDFRVTLGAELREVEIKPNYLINPQIIELLELYNEIGLDTRGESALAAIKSKLPQESAWDEQHLLLTVGADWDAYEDLSFAAQYSYYNISRDGYQSTKGKVNRSVEDQTTNHQLDGWIFVKPTRDLTFFLHGRAYSNFLLGDRPLLYNARVNHRFTDPFGYLSAGVVWEF